MRTDASFSAPKACSPLALGLLPTRAASRRLARVDPTAPAGLLVPGIAFQPSPPNWGAGRTAGWSCTSMSGHGMCRSHHFTPQAGLSIPIIKRTIMHRPIQSRLPHIGQPHAEGYLLTIDQPILRSSCIRGVKKAGQSGLTVPAGTPASCTAPVIFSAVSDWGIGLRSESTGVKLSNEPSSLHYPDLEATISVRHWRRLARISLPKRTLSSVRLP